MTMVAVGLGLERVLVCVFNVNKIEKMKFEVETKIKGQKRETLLEIEPTRLT